MSRIARKVLELSDRPNTRLLYGVAATATTVYIDGSTTAVTVTTLDDVAMATDDYVALLADGADYLVIGVVGTSAWATFSMNSANWTLTRPPEWRRVGDMIQLRGAVVRINSSFGVGSTFATLATSSIPSPHQTHVMSAAVILASASPAASSQMMVVTSTIIRNSTSGTLIAIGDTVYFDQIAYSVTA